MPDGGYIVRVAAPGDVPAILDLMERGLGRGQFSRSVETWNWKHVQNPFGPSGVLLADSGGQIIGLRAFMRWAWQDGQDLFRAVRAVDTVTHPDWQGRGIFRDLTLRLVEQMEAEGVGFVFNTPNNQSRPGYLKMGWQVVGRAPLWIRLLRPFGALVAVLKGDRQAPTADSPCAEPIAPLLEEPWLGPFLATVRGGPAGRRWTPLTIPYLRWRYVAIPGVRYHAAFLERRGTRAAVIYRLRRRGSLVELRVCEMLVPPGSDGVRLGRTVLREITRQSGADFASCVTQRGTPERGVVRALGFLPVLRAGPIVTVRPVSPGVIVGDLVDASGWRFSSGDLELF